MEEKIIEIFGKRVKFVQDDGSSKGCEKCALYYYCSVFKICEDSKGNHNCHFVEVDENGNEL